MSRVFVVQKQMRFDRPSGELVPKFDLGAANQYGDLVYLLSPSAAPWNPESILPELRERLGDFSSCDYLLLLGNPCLIGWAVAVAAQANDGQITLLQWNGKEKRYIPVESNIYHDFL